MADNNILVPVDFTVSAEKALDFASFISKKNNMNITFLHVDNSKKGSVAENKLKLITNDFNENKIQSSYIIRKGKILQEILDEASEPNYKFMIIGSHGYKGLQEKLMGTDILKLVKSLPIPAIVVQKEHVIPEEGIKTIIFPVGSHENFINKINATIFLAKIFRSEVHIYTIRKEGLEWSQELRFNIELSVKSFEQNAIPFQRIIEEQSVFSVGYSKQTLQYAEKIKAKLIAIMSNPTNEYYYIADSDKESLLTNKANIPILCTNEKKLSEF